MQVCVRLILFVVRADVYCMKSIFFFQCNSCKFIMQVCVLLIVIIVWADVYCAIGHDWQCCCREAADSSVRVGRYLELT